MEAPARSLLAALLVVALLVPAMASAAEAPGATRIIEDAEGDARDDDSGTVYDAGLDLIDQNPRHNPNERPMRAGGLPAPPYLDILAVEVADSPSELTISMQLAQVPSSFHEALPKGDVVIYTVCWQWGGQNCREIVSLVVSHGGSADYVESAYSIGAFGCSRGKCSVAVPLQIEAGEKGWLRWHVPRDVIPDRPEKDRLVKPYAYAGRLLDPPDVFLMSPERHFGGTWVRTDVDIAGPGKDYTLQTRPEPKRPTLARWDAPVPGLVRGEDEPELDLLQGRIIETPDNLTVALQFALVAEPARKQVTPFALAFMDGRYFYGRIVSSGAGNRSWTVAQCTPTATDACPDEPIPATLNVHVGNGGWLNLTIDRTLLGSPPRGLSSAKFSAAVIGDPNDMPLTPAYANAGFDVLAVAPQFTLRYDTGGTMEPESSVHLVDAADEGIAGDLVVADIVALPGGIVATDISLGRPLPPDQTYWIAAALEAPAQDRPARMLAARVTGGTATFVCGLDTLVLAAPRAIPTGATPAAGSITPTTIHIEAPRSCLGAVADLPLEAARFGATILQEMPDGSLVVVDDAVEVGSVSIASLAPAPIVPASSSPWLIGGIGTSLFLALFVLGVLVFRRPAPVEPIPGKVFLKRYRVERLIGEGGFGRVWLATDRKTREPVVLKWLHAAGDSAAITRLEAEAEMLSSLDHPNIVRLRHVDEVNSRLYLVMEYVPGGTMEAALSRGIPRSNVIALLRDVLDGLSVIHARDIIHRDLKPQNILIDAEGRGKIADFGIARREGATPTLAATPGPGTPEYMAPELFRAERASVQSDLYAVGMIAMRALPRDGRLQLWTARAVANDPTARFGTASEMRIALDKIEGGHLN